MLFEEMSPLEKIAHIEKCMADSLPHAREATCLADVLDVWDYWVPYLIERLKKTEAVVEAAKKTLKESNEYFDDDGGHFSRDKLEAALKALED